MRETVENRFRLAGEAPKEKSSFDWPEGVIAGVLALFGAVFFLIVFLIGFYAMQIVSAQKVKAHEWYPQECCSDRDCRPLADNEIDQNIRMEPDGEFYLLKWDRKVKHKGYSPDGKYHICELASTFYCLFIPLPSGS